MANSREQCLDEDAVFLPVTASSPEFLHCEKERQAVERLLSAGPEAFYSSIGTERSGCFLSTEEVNKISSWAQDYQLQELREAHGEETNSEKEDFCSTYFPSNTDTPTPNLELGWPPKGPWMQKGSFTVHTSPPAEGEPAVREIIRRTLQKASQVIAIVTDRLTDGAIIGDLHNAASRGVPVYVILNQRSVQENYTLHRLRHPNIRVRVLGGKSFCSRMGRMVVGEMKNKFLLVDLETAIHGSYSLTWTDAHLHRQLITVLRGPAVDLFDKEFRILFAASLPAPDTCRVAGTHVDVGHQLKDLSNLRFENHLPLDPDITSPPSPYADFLLDWETMEVFQKDPCSPDSLLEHHEKIWLMKMQQQNNIPCDENSPLIDSLTYNGNPLVDERSRLTKTTSPVTNKLPEDSTTLNYTESSSIHLTPEKMNRVDILIKKALTKIHNLDESTTTLDHKPKETTHNMAMQSSSKLSSREPFLEETQFTSDVSSRALFSRVENAPSSRKPLILKLPQSESFSSVSDIMKRFYPQQSSSSLLKKGPKTALAELSQSMTELSTHTTDTNDFPVPKLNANCFPLDNLTPACALLKKRDNDLKHKLFSIPKDVMLGERPRSSRYGLDWRRSLAERERNQETEARK